MNMEHSADETCRAICRELKARGVEVMPMDARAFIMDQMALLVATNWNLALQINDYDTADFIDHWVAIIEYQTIKRERLGKYAERDLDRMFQRG